MIQTGRPKPSTLCHYCDDRVGPRGEYDHAPTPRNVGGVEVEPTCLACHHLKDRMPVSGWFLPAYVMACQEFAGRGLAQSDFSKWPEQWGDMSRECRILWAKMAREVNRGSSLPELIPA